MSPAELLEAIRSHLQWFRRDIGFRAPELQDEAWESLAEHLVYLATGEDEG